MGSPTLCASPSFLNRSRFHIIYEVLSLCSTSTQKTRILRTVNINSGQFRKYAVRLIDNGLLIEEDDAFRTTDQGQRFVKTYEALAALFPREPLLSKGK
jgi:predicted transcriptional regulator